MDIEHSSTHVTESEHTSCAKLFYLIDEKIFGYPEGSEKPLNHTLITDNKLKI